MNQPTHRPIFHFITPDPHPSPFDVNMAVDAGFHVTCYTNVTLAQVTGLAQDAIFSRAPDAAPFTCMFIGGRQIGLAMDMLDAVKRACVPPFMISAFADPSGSFTTAAAVIATIEAKLRTKNTSLNGKKLVIFGGKGVVGGLAGVIAARQGARVTLVGHSGIEAVSERATEYQKIFSGLVGGGGWANRSGAFGYFGRGGNRYRGGARGDSSAERGGNKFGQKFAGGGRLQRRPPRRYRIHQRL